MYDFTKIHIDILEQLSKIDKCYNFILTEQQFKNALDTNQQIIKPYIGFTNEKKEYINIRDFVLDKLQKYKIVGVKTGKYGEIKGDYRLPGGCGGSWTDNYFYIIFVNIHGDTYGNIFLENRNKEYYSSNKIYCGWSNNFIPNDWFLELFIKPFAIKPQIYTCRGMGCNCHMNQKVSCIKSYVWDNLHWAPFIDKEHYSCRSILDLNKNLIERYYEPTYKKYIESDKFIPENIMTDILNKKDFILSLLENTPYKWNTPYCNNVQLTFNIYDSHYLKYIDTQKKNEQTKLIDDKKITNINRHNIKILYHQTDLDSATNICKTQKILRGKKGIVGPGIYFADNPNDTCHKAKKGGVVLEAHVDLGNSLNIHRKDVKPYTYSELINLGFNSITLNGMKGTEYIVYSCHQVKNINVYKPKQIK
jgi:hypothetical protein